MGSSKKEERHGLESSILDPSGLELTSGFRKSPTTMREGFFQKTPENWMDHLRHENNIGLYWRIHDKLYDFTDFMDRHPGGTFWLKTTQGTDITESFVSSHLTNLPEEVLKKFFVKTISSPRFSPFTFKENGFYMTLKRKAKQVLQGVETGPTTYMKIIQDGLFIAFLSMLIYGTFTSSYLVIILTGLVLTLSTNCAHNFFHQKDNWRMFMFDFSVLSSQDWRITHAISHHLYPNTIQDYEVFVSKPLVELYPMKDKGFFHKYISYTPLNPIYYISFLIDYCRRGIQILAGSKSMQYSFFIQPLLIILMAFISKSFTAAIMLWFVLQLSFTFTFYLIGWTAGHHTHYAYIESDSINKDRDWGLHQVIAIAERKAAMTNMLLSSVSFGNHTLHHLFPTVDLSRLHLLIKPMLETCEEFGVDFPFYTLWDVFSTTCYRFYNNIPNDLPVQLKFREYRTTKGLHDFNKGKKKMI